MRPPTIYELCRPRADVLEGRIRDKDFAADLSQVLKGTAPELYKNPAVFFANTHPTRGLRDLFLAVVDRLTSYDGAGAGVAQPASPGVIERTDNVKTALTKLVQQVSSSGKRIKSLAWRINSGDGFLPMALLKAEPGATVRVEMMEGGWSSGDGSAEWSFDFNGTPEEAAYWLGMAMHRKSPRRVLAALRLLLSAS